MENSAHYCDLAGEATFIRKNLDEFSVVAKANRVRIVHSCASVAVPAEVMTLMVAHHMATVHGKQLGHVTDCAHPRPLSAFT